MTPAQLAAIMPEAGTRVLAFAGPLDAAMTEHGVSTPRRQAAFLAQVAHESGELLYTHELESGAAYEGRADLGNTQPGDGERFKGRGLLQITGRANYADCGAALSLPLTETPALLETPAGACRSAAWFWTRRGLSLLADVDHFGEITHRINGGYIGLDERLSFWLKARKVFGL